MRIGKIPYLLCENITERSLHYGSGIEFEQMTVSNPHGRVKFLATKKEIPLDVLCEAIYNEHYGKIEFLIRENAKKYPLNYC